MDAEHDWNGKLKMARVENFPVKAINLSGRSLIARKLDVTSDSFAKCDGGLQDWQGLAERVGLETCEILALADKPNKTLSIIERFSQTSNATIGRLLYFLEQMERFDILEDTTIQDRILCDVEKYKQKEKADMIACGLVQPDVQVYKVQSTCWQMLHEPQPLSPIPFDQINEFDAITVDDVKHGRMQYYDAFVCYTMDDFSFVREAMKMLEEHHGLKLCIPDRDLLGGPAKYSALAHLIEERCRKMIILLSPSYASSRECSFMTIIGRSISAEAMQNKLIPVIIKKPCPMPDILRYIVTIDYTKCDLSPWFWNKLVRSIQTDDSSSFMLHSSGSTNQLSVPVVTSSSINQSDAISDGGCMQQDGAQQTNEPSVMRQNRDMQISNSSLVNMDIPRTSPITGSLLEEPKTSPFGTSHKQYYKNKSSGTITKQKKKIQWRIFTCNQSIERTEN